MKDAPNPEPRTTNNRGIQIAIGLGYQLMAAMLVFVGGGYYLDLRWHTGHLFTLAGVGLAFLYGGYEVWKLVRILNQDEQKNTPSPK